MSARKSTPVADQTDVSAPVNWDEAPAAFQAPDPVEQALREKQAEVAAAPIPGLGQTPPDQLTAILASIAQTLAAIQAQGTNAGNSAQLDNIAKFLMHQEQTRPHENLFNPPMVSHYNPLGERDHPRPELKCDMYWVGYKLHKEGLTPLEIDLLNKMKPGSYWVTKADLRRIRLNIKAKEDDAGQLEKLTFHFPCKGPEDRQSHAPMTQYLREILGENVTIESLLAQVEKLKAQVAAQGGQS